MTIEQKQEAERKAHLAEARELGEAAGKAAAGWVVDGNTDPAHIARLVQMLDDGDPQADDYLPARPNLSGEWADAPTPRSLFEDITGWDAHAEASWNADAYGAYVDALCAEWEAGVDATFDAECERLLRAALS